jgi:hypothetical protein
VRQPALLFGHEYMPCESRLLRTALKKRAPTNPRIAIRSSTYEIRALSTASSVTRVSTNGAAIVPAIRVDNPPIPALMTSALIQTRTIAYAKTLVASHGHSHLLLCDRSIAGERDHGKLLAPEGSLAKAADVYVFPTDFSTQTVNPKTTRTHENGSFHFDPRIIMPVH